MNIERKPSHVSTRLLFVLVLTAFLCGSALAEITLDSKASNGAFDPLATPVVSLTWTHTVVACTNCSFYVAVSTYASTPTLTSRVVSVTLDGIAVTSLGSKASGIPGNSTAELFTLLGPLTAGDHTVVVTFIPAGVQYGFGSSFLFNGVDQTSPNSSFVSASGNSAAPGLTMSGDARGSLVLNVLASTPSAGFMLEGAGQDVCDNGLIETTCTRGRRFYSSAFDIGAVSRKVALGLGTAISWTMSNADQWAIGAVAIQPGLSPTASGISISGQLHAAGGRGVGGAIVLAQDMNGDVRTTRSNPFGYFSFEDLPAGGTYVIGVRSKLYTFQPVIVSPDDNLTGVDLYAVGTTDPATARPR